MHFKINVSLNIDTNHSLRMGNRTARLRHERREHGYTDNPSIDEKLSKYNNINGVGFNNYYNFHDRMNKILKPYVDHHNNLKSVKKNPDRKITDLSKFLDKRGKRIPYRFIVIKLGTGADNKKLLELFRKKGYSDKDYYLAFDQTVHDYGEDFNKINAEKGNHLSFDHLDANVDETLRHGAPHAHGGMLANATTKSGKTSLSFDRATRQAYGGTSNISAWSIMRNKEDHRFLKIATKNFQKYLGPDFQFDLQRNPHSSSGMAHDDFIKTKTKQDEYTQQSKLNERNSRKSLLRNNRSLINQNQKLRNLVRSLTKENNSLANQAVSEITIQEAEKSANSLVEQNELLKSQLRKLSQNYDLLKNKYQTMLNGLLGLVHSRKNLAKLLNEPNKLLRNLLVNTLSSVIRNNLKKKN